MFSQRLLCSSLFSFYSKAISADVGVERDVGHAHERECDERGAQDRVLGDDLWALVLRRERQPMGGSF